MKLYTKLQVSEAMTLARLTDDSEGDIFKQLTPIELPSDEKIKKASPKTDTLFEHLGEIGWIEGAKWMRDKIQGGNV